MIMLNGKSWSITGGQSTALVLLLLLLQQSAHSSQNNVDNSLVINGSVTLAILAEVNYLRNGTCGDVNVHSLQEAAAVTWFLDAVNALGYVPGVTIGLEVYRTCRLPYKAARDVITLIQKHHVGQNVSMQQRPLLGIVGPDRTAEAVPVASLIGYLPTNQQLIQISGSATGRELSFKTLHPNFFRVVTSDFVQIKLMQKLLEKLDWNYVAIVYDDDDYGRSSSVKLQKLLREKKICIPVFASLPLDAQSSAFRTIATDVAGQLDNTDNGLIRGLIIIASDSSIQQLLQILDTQVNSTQLVLSEAVGFNLETLTSSNGQIIPLAKGALITTPVYIPVPEFEHFWSQLWTNDTLFSVYADRLPWLSAYFGQLTGCSRKMDAACWDRSSAVRSNLISSGEAVNNLYVGYSVKAAAVMVELLKRMHDDKCGASFSGVCAELVSSIAGRKDIQDTLESATLSLAKFSPLVSAFGAMTSLRFDNNGDIVVDQGDILYTLYNLKSTNGSFSFKQVGKYKKYTSVDIDTTSTEFYNETGSPMTWTQLPRAQCDVNHDCLKCDHDVSSDIMFLEGDFYVIGLFPVSARNRAEPLKCGEVRGWTGADVAQGLLFAVQEINKKTGVFSNILPGKKVGVVGLNTCSSPLHVRQLLTDLYAGRLSLPDGRNSSILVGKIMGVVGAVSSDNSIAASDTLTRLQTTFVQVSGSSTSTALSDRNKHPYFMRLVPADDTQAKVLLDIVDRVGANYIQVIYDSSTDYATGLLHNLQEQTTSSISGNHYNICIAQSIPITAQTLTNQYAYVLDKLRDKSSAKFVIVILRPAYIQKLMAAILPLMTSQDDFLFLGSEIWGRKEELIRGRSRLEGSLVLSLEIPADHAFQTHFTSLDLTKTLNPWLSQFWEARLNCFMDKSFKRRDRTPCLQNFAANYTQDSLVPFYIQSTYALVKGFAAAWTQYCQGSVTAVCDSLTSARLVSAMHGVELDFDGKGPVFDSKGDGLVGYKVLQVSRDSNSAAVKDLVYQDVGSWTAGNLKLDHDEVILLKGIGFDSRCPQTVECGRCFRGLSVSTPPPPPRGDAAIEGLPIPIAVGLGVMLIVIIVLLVVVLVVFVCRRRKNKGNQPQHIAMLARLQLQDQGLGHHHHHEDNDYNQPAMFADPGISIYDTAEEMHNIRRPVAARAPSPPPRPSNSYLHPSSDVNCSDDAVKCDPDDDYFQPI